MQFCKLFI